MSLICMAVHSTDKNGRTKYTKQTLWSLLDTVDFFKHRLIIINDDSCQRCIDMLGDYGRAFDAVFPKENLEILHNKTNLGTANSINRGIKRRKKDECVIKMDDDCIVHQRDWIEDLEGAIVRQPKIGILGLKRKDLIESPYNTSEVFKSRLIMLPHTSGDVWIIVEQVKGVMGTCTMYNPRLLDAVGFLQQLGTYGYDDSLISLRSEVSGFANAFLSHINIDHIDTGRNEDGSTNEYIEWKQERALQIQKEVSELAMRIENKSEPYYYEPDWQQIDN